MKYLFRNLLALIQHLLTKNVSKSSGLEARSYLRSNILFAHSLSPRQVEPRVKFSQLSSFNQTHLLVISSVTRLFIVSHFIFCLEHRVWIELAFFE